MCFKIRQYVCLINIPTYKKPGKFPISYVRIILKYLMKEIIFH